MKTLTIIISICFFLISCEKDGQIEKNRRIEKVGMVEIEDYNITDTVLVNEIATFAIKASATSGCWSDLFVNLEKTDTYKYSIKAYGTFSCFEWGCACPCIMVYHDTLISFQPNQKGKYLFQVQENFNTIYIDTLIVK